MKRNKSTRGPLRQLFSKKTIATALCAFLLATNTVLAYAPESNFWEHRKQSSQSQPSNKLAALPTSPNPAQILQRLPSALKPSLSSSLSHAVSPSSSLA